MKSFAVSVAVVSLTGLVLISQGVTEENLAFFPAGTQDDPDLFSFDEPQETVEVAPADPVESLREQYLEAARQRASLMDEAALRAAVESENSLVAELRAKQALQQVEQKLEQIIGEYPETAAGQRARRLLITLQATEDRDQSNLQPFPDEEFGRPDDERRRESDDFSPRERPEFLNPRRDPDPAGNRFERPDDSETSDDF